MTVRARTEVEEALLAKGMELDESHHHMFRKKLEGVTHLVTRTSHGGSSQIDDNLGKLMANQLCLQLREFWNLVECPLTEADWDDLVRQRCAGGRNPFLGR